MPIIATHDRIMSIIAMRDIIIAMPYIVKFFIKI